MNNFVITHSIATYWNKFPIHTLYSIYVYILLLTTKNSHMQSIHKTSFLHVKIACFIYVHLYVQIVGFQ